MTQATDDAKNRITELLERDGVIIVSEGTLRYEALIEKFAFWLGLEPEKADDPQEYLIDLALAMEDAAPEGYCFSSLEGDGACFGFWEVENDG